ncbi:MAG TPA: ECF-type sigma factor [Terriglobia bacterium]|nr:ECF-type sigma factor [Terriglobia bacterium]
MRPAPGEVTYLLNELKQGDSSAWERLIPLVYDELQRQAAYYLRRERPGHTLQPTALVHEAYVRLIEQHGVPDSRERFFVVAASLMRRILVDHARKKRARKRPPQDQRISMDAALECSVDGLSQVIAVDEALNRLAERNERQAHVVELRYFSGLSDEETAEALGISARQVRRDWKVAKTWLYDELNR